MNLIDFTNSPGIVWVGPTGDTPTPRKSRRHRTPNRRADRAASAGVAGTVMFYLGWPQALVVLLMISGLVMDALQKPTGINVTASVLARALTLGLLYWGGFFSVCAT